MKSDNNFKLCREDELLLRCARISVDPETEDKIVSLVCDDLDWEYLLQMTSKHNLTPLVYNNLNSIYPERVPNNVLSDLKTYFNANIHKNLLMTGELIKILKIFKEENINAIPYKGPVLAYLAYGKISFRDFGDIDILINKSDALRAKDVVISNGYELYYPLMINDSFYMKFEPEYQFFNRNTGILIEIKWKIEGNFFSLPNSNNLSKNLETVNINGFEVSTFSHINLLLILCIHAAKHDWKRLSWICDISELIKSQDDINWLEFFQKAETLGVKRIILVNLLLARDLFHLALPDGISFLIEDPITVKISNQVKKRIFKQKSLNIFEKLILDLKKRDNIIYGIKDCINGLTRPTYVDYLDIALPESLFFLYFFIRPFLLLKRYGKDSI